MAPLWPFWLMLGPMKVGRSKHPKPVSRSSDLWFVVLRHPIRRGRAAFEPPLMKHRLGAAGLAAGSDRRATVGAREAALLLQAFPARRPGRARRIGPGL